MLLTRLRAICPQRLHTLTRTTTVAAGDNGALRVRAHGSASASAPASAPSGSPPRTRTFATESTATTATAASARSSGSSGGRGPWVHRGAMLAAAAAVLYAVSRSEERTLPPQPAKHIRGEGKEKQQQQYANAKVETPASVPAAATAAAARVAAMQAASLGASLPPADAAAMAAASAAVDAVPTGSATAEGEPSPSHPDHASCRACRDGSEETAYLQQQQQQQAATAGAASAAGSSSDATASPASASAPACPPCFAYSHGLCPLNRAEVGRASWGYLHTLAAYYPEHPTARQRSEMAELIRLFMKLYPCAYCADRSVEQIEREPLHLHNHSQRALAQWMCRAHNEVNERIGKPIFDCAFVDQRWRDGPPTGECD